MNPTIKTGLDVLTSENQFLESIRGNVAYLCHSASVNAKLEHGILIMKRLLGDRLKKLFSPQHGLVGDVQDNMVETTHYQHPYFKLPIYSLYSETRKPTAEMLEDIDTVVVDLQDVGTRVYTYIYTLTLTMEACAAKGIRVVVLDRPNPVNAERIEGNILDMNYQSFVGRHPIAVRHGLTIGELGLMANKYFQEPCDLEVITMQGYERAMHFEDTGLPWVMPSPNLPTIEAAFPFIGTVLFEGTNISEGRGTTRSLEIIGHPDIEPYAFLELLLPKIHAAGLSGFKLRPVVFLPTFQKHQGKSCGGYQIHVTDRDEFRPWLLTQLLCRELYHYLGDKFQWKQPPYEYEYEKMPIDMINGTDKIRHWVTENGSMASLKAIEQEGMDDFMAKRKTILCY